MELNNVNLAAQAAVGFDLDIIHPATGEKLGGIITIRGDESKEVQNYNRKRFQEMQKRERMNKGKNTDYTLAEIEDISIESAIVRCMGWKNIKKDGIELEFNKENAEMVFRDYPWIRSQVMEAASDLSLFPLEEFEQAKLFVEQEFTLSERQADGRTLRENLENVERQLKRKPKELEDLVELPEAFQEYWQWFLRLSNHRPSGMGVSAIPYSEYVAFFQLIGVEVEPYELEILEVFDNIAMRHYAKQQEKEQVKAKQKAARK